MAAREAIEFVKAAVRRPLEVSTVFPTSASLANRLLDFTNVDESTSVVEVGAGTGAITRHLRGRLAPNARFLGVELDEPMVAFLRNEFPELRFEAGPAEDLSKWVPANSVRTVISSLPWTVFNPALRDRTLSAIHKSLARGGVFATYVCANAMVYPQAKAFIGELHRRFRSVERAPLEWRNIPPAFVFRAVK